VTRQTAQFDQASEPRFVAAVRRRGQQHRASRATGDLVAQVIAIRVAAHRVRFIDHHQVPRIARKRIRDVPLLEEIRGGDPDARLPPRVVADSAGLRPRVEARPMRDHARDVKAVGEFLHPLIAKRGRCDHQHSPHGIASQQFRDDESSLNGLAEPHFVGDQDARLAGEDGHCRFKLMGQDFGPRANGGRRQADIV
jgi:hypothetical protein